MGRKPLGPTERKQQISLALPPALRGYLEEAAAKANSTVSDEIRRRLHDHIWEEQHFDRRTRELAFNIMELAEGIRRTYAPWHKSEKAFQAFTAAITAWLGMVDRVIVSIVTEPGRPVDLPDPFGEDDPATIGRMMARTLLQNKEDFQRELDAGEAEDRLFEKERPEEFKKTVRAMEKASKRKK